jgi:hypothetical protein
MPETPNNSPLTPLVYDWAILARKTLLPLIVSGLFLLGARFGFVGPETQAVADHLGEAVIVIVLALVSRADWVKYIEGMTRPEDQQ